MFGSKKVPSAEAVLYIYIIIYNVYTESDIIMYNNYSDYYMHAMHANLKLCCCPCRVVLMRV